MDDSHRKLLQKYRMAIVKDLDPQRIMGYLARLDTFSEDDEEEVKSMDSRSARAEKLLDILPRKEPGTFECFVRALQKEFQHLAKPLIAESGLVMTPSVDDQGKICCCKRCCSFLCFSCFCTPLILFYILHRYNSSALVLSGK